MVINAMQWNPHWECFEQSDECKSQVNELLSIRLMNGTDFANVVELEDDDFTMPAGWRNISSTCGRDSTHLFFDSTRWKLSAAKPSGQKGCMVQMDRPYVVQAFEHHRNGIEIVVIGAHFPHRTLGSALSESIKSVVSSTGIRATLLIADTNINQPGAFPSCPASFCKTSADIMKAIGVAQENDTVVSTDLLKTCCENPPWRYAFAFDRVIANFGTGMSTQLHDDPAPSWAVGAFHKAVTGQLVVPLISKEMLMSADMERIHI